MYARLAEACGRHGLAMPAPVSSWDPSSATKRCTGCESELPTGEFAIRRRSTGRRQARCRACQAEFRRDHYERNKQRLLWEVAARKRDVKIRNMIRIVEYLSKHPCVDCGEADPLVLEFDHVRGSKTENVTAMVHLADWSRIAAEIAKCVVRCANCHRRKTLAGLGYLRAVVVQQVGHLPSKQAVDGVRVPATAPREGVPTAPGGLSAPRSNPGPARRKITRL